jgi:penicillin-binding protein 1A
MSAFQMTNIMEGVIQSGTAQKLKVLNRPIAGKTGTTNDYKDAWFIGFTPDLAVGVYIGYDQPSSLGHGETGGNLAAPVVRDFMREALADVPPVPFRAAVRHQARARQSQDRIAGRARRQDGRVGGVQAGPGACRLGA